LFEHLEVDIVYGRFPKNYRRVLTTWSASVPLLSGDSDDYNENELKKIERKENNK